MNAWVYILSCKGGAFYVGSTRGDLDMRVSEHNAGKHPGFTKSRRPMTLVYSQSFKHITGAVAAERQVKGWGRAKKKALILGNFEALKVLSKSRTRPLTSSG